MLRLLLPVMQLGLALWVGLTLTYITVRVIDSYETWQAGRVWRQEAKLLDRLRREQAPK